jgi:hypothetical protein
MFDLTSRIGPGFRQVQTLIRASQIKSIQRGTIAITGATSNTATITAVSMANSRLRWLGQTYSDAATAQNMGFARLALTDATTITATVDTSPGAQTTTVSYEITEYYPGVIRSVQRGTIIGAATAALTAVVLNKTEVDYLGHTESAADGIVQYQPRLALTNPTTLTQSVVVNAATTTGYQVVQWW